MEQKKHWWEGYPWRMVQTNLREIDMEDIDAEAYARQMKDFGATVVTLNAAGIIASYDTRLPFHTKSEYLHGSSLREIVDACHKRGIRVIARMDFSKIRFPLYERHTDWAYRDRDGNILNYNGSVQTCPNGGYQGEAMFEILREALTEIPFDGVFCNMAGFLVVDYSGVYHGPCHCENCKRLFKAQYGGDVPEKDDFRNPAYRKYTAFKSACLKAHKEKMIAAIRGVSPEIAINGVDYIRTESNVDIGYPQWMYSASSNSRLSGGLEKTRPADNACVDFIGFRYRDISVSPHLVALRHAQSLANAGSLSLFIMGRLDNHPDVSSFAPTRRAFAFHAAHQDLFTHMRSAAETVLVRSGMMAREDPEGYGWVRALTESHIPFDEIKAAELTDPAQSVDISFGMSLESGLIHANRVGDMDSGIIPFLRHEGLTDEEIMAGFQKNGGLKGISGVSGDLRYVEEAAAAGNERARLAIGTFVSGIVHYIGAFYLDLGRLDTLVFTAGIGEHSAAIRRMVCERLLPLGVKLDEEKNRACNGQAVISAADSKVRVLVIPTDEELGIVRKTWEMK